MNMTATTQETATKNAAVATLQKMLRSENLGLATEQEWLELAHHIEVHKYLINEKITWTVTWDDAVFSWFENIYQPLLRAIERWEVRNAFPGRSIGQLYLAVATHWYFLKERNDAVTADDAALDFAGHYGTGIARWFSRFLQPSPVRS
jgi:hypothetical protein